MATRVQLQGVKVTPLSAEASRNLIVHGTSLGELPGGMSSQKKNSTASHDLSVGRIFVMGGIPVAAVTLGIALLIGSATRHPVVPNPYVALFTFLSGLALLATAAAAIRENRGS
jgi:hypothetical protein